MIRAVRDLSVLEVVHAHESWELARERLSAFLAATRPDWDAARIARDYGEPRFTRDVDVVAGPGRAQLSALLARFPAPDFYVSDELKRI